MNIAIVGQQKYEVQDWASLAFALRFYDYAEASMVVEPNAGEDFELRPDPAAELIEVQAKAAHRQVDLGKLCSVLAHSGKRTAANMLLERLLTDARYAVLVASGRCDDATSKFARRLDDDLGSPRALPTIKETRAFLSAFGKAKVEGTPGRALHRSRVERVADFAAAADVEGVRNALSRVFIVENQRQSDLEHYVWGKLGQLEIAGDAIRDLERRLLEIIRRCKGTGKNVLVELRTEIERARPDPLRPPGYVSRGDETALANELSKRRVLLLSGRPRVGKSWLAREIGASLQTKGFSVREYSDSESAERFLADPGGRERAAILDDPLGGASPVAAPRREYERVGRMIGRLRAHRRLIVAQGLNRLLETTGTSRLAEVVTGSTSWHDVGFPSGDFLIQLWTWLCEDYEVPDWLSERVAKAIADGDTSIEAGCLQYLAATHSKLNDNANIESIFRHAREDISSIAETLAAEGHGALLAGLAVATRRQEPIGEQTLAFVLGSGGSTLPGQAPKFRVISIPASYSDAGPPAYDRPPKLNHSQRMSLDALRRRGIITHSSKQVAFAHPIYRAAAEYLVKREADIGPFIEMVQRALLSLSPTTSRAASDNLHWLIEICGAVDQGGRIFDVAESGLAALYPTTRDACYRFLMRYVGEVPEKRRNLESWIGAVRSVDLDTLNWIDGEAVVPGSELGAEWFLRSLEEVERKQVQKELDLLKSDDDLTPQQAAAALSYLEDQPEDLDAYMMGRLLSFDEGVIRAEAVKVWLDIDRNNDDELLERIFTDEHPLIALAALKAVIGAWQFTGEDRHATLARGLVRLAQDPGCAAALLDELVVFERDHSREGPPWKLFETLMPEVIRSHPEQVSLVAERFFNVLREAMEVISPEAMVTMCDAWKGLIERQLASGKLGNDSMLGIASILIRSTSHQPELRGDRLEKLMRLEGTGASVRIIADLIDDWDLLCNDEKQLVLTRLAEPREDQIWLRAVALSRATVPVKVAEGILGLGVTLDRKPGELVASLRGDLLEAVVHVHLGTQPFWYLGLQHSAGVRWDPVIDCLARDPAHPLFELAVIEILRRARSQQVADLIQHLGVAQADRMLELMLRVKIQCTGNFMPGAWAALLSHAPDKSTRDRWLDRMADEAWLILDRFQEIGEWLSAKVDREDLAKRLTIDLAVSMLIINIGKIAGPNSQGMGEVIRAAEIFAEKVLGKARLYGTYGDLADALRRHGSNNTTLIEKLVEQRNQILDARKNRRMVEEDIGSNWIRP